MRRGSVTFMYSCACKKNGGRVECTINIDYRNYIEQKQQQKIGVICHNNDQIR